MRKMRSFISIAMLLCLLLAGCSTAQVAKEPTFAECEDGVDFTAYSAPTLNTRVGPQLEDAYQKLAEAGFTL